MIYITKQKGLNQNKGCLPFGQPSRFTVCVNGKQNSGLVNFVPEWRLPVVQISSIFRKTAAKAWNWYQRLFWRTRKTSLPSKMFRCSRKFLLERPMEVVIHLLSSRIFRELFVNGKQLRSTLASFPPVTVKLTINETAGTRFLSSEDLFEILSLSTAEHYFFRIGWSLQQSTGPFLPRASKYIFQTRTLLLRTKIVHFVR